jgi:hypothetical protein
VTVKLKLIRPNTLRSFRLVYEIRIDGECIGRIKRGQTLTHDMAEGKHSIQAVFAAANQEALWQRRSPAIEVSAHNGDTVTMRVDLGAASNPLLKSSANDEWLSLTTVGDNRTMAAHRVSIEAVSRLLLAIIAILAVVASAILHAGTLRIESLTLAIVASAVLAYLLHRRFREHFR